MGIRVWRVAWGGGGVRAVVVGAGLRDTHGRRGPGSDGGGCAGRSTAHGSLPQEMPLRDTKCYLLALCRFYLVLTTLLSSFLQVARSACSQTRPDYGISKRRSRCHHVSNTAASLSLFCAIQRWSPVGALKEPAAVISRALQKTHRSCSSWETKGPGSLGRMMDHGGDRVPRS